MNYSDFKIVFMGTPEFAVGPLKTIFEAGLNISAVITAADKPAGRGKTLQSSAVKKYALEKRIPVLQPTNLKDPEFIRELSAIKPDLQVVVAFRMLPEIVWKLPRLGTFNLHASLLPQYRGAAPINHAIINGDKKSGVTTFFIDDKIDTGKILFQEEIEIEDDYNAGDLHDKLMELGSGLVLKTIKSIFSGKVVEIPQDSLVTSSSLLLPAPKIFKDDCKINWDWEGRRIYNFIRGLSPQPAAFCMLSKPKEQSLVVKIFETEFIPAVHSHKTGSLICPDKKSLHAAVKDGYISIKSLQLPGKNRVDILSFLNGFKNITDYSLS